MRAGMTENQLNTVEKRKDELLKEMLARQKKPVFPDVGRLIPLVKPEEDTEVVKPKVEGDWSSYGSSYVRIDLVVSRSSK